jgi:hypothetical protein
MRGACLLQLPFSKEVANMMRHLGVVLIFLVALAAVSGCGLLPTDKPPTDSKFSVHYFPDEHQPAWERLLFGTRWIAEGPAQ